MEVMYFMEVSKINGLSKLNFGNGLERNEKANSCSNDDGLYRLVRAVRSCGGKKYEYHT